MRSGPPVESRRWGRAARERGERALLSMKMAYKKELVNIGVTIMAPGRIYCPGETNTGKHGSMNSSAHANGGGPSIVPTHPAGIGGQARAGSWSVKA